ncbi:hypothetical protein CASFOL_035501 [Castilleja foliolosa]|uniref:Uncharacterized protein n=1 Tax=Castilleja foliolosa TaxID=1961234 RepID=A0ABD3BU21_9LAMI
MRIRKNAKVSPLAHMVKPGYVIQVYDCRLNQSPWDVMNFSPPSTPHSLLTPPSSPVNRKNACAISGSAPVDIPITDRTDNGKNLQCKRKVENSSHEDYYYSDFGPKWGKRRRRS